MTKALEGVRILDFTHVQSGPTCTQLLAWFGADVIKVERAGEGDATRGQLRDIPGVDSLYFTMLNHNKRSITLDTKKPEGRKVLDRLIKTCDVLVENFAPGAKFSTSTSQVLIRLSRTSLPLGFLVSSVIERLLWFSIVKYKLSAPGMSRSWPRVASPSPARSTLITSAPNHASSWVQVGPDCTWVKSRMRTPSSALLIDCLLL